MNHLTDIPALETGRLSLRGIRAEDIDFVFEGLSDPRVTAFYAVAFPTLEATREQMDWYDEIWRRRSGLWWAICRRDTGEPVGAIGFNNCEAGHRRAELGYWLLPRFWGRGYASEALQAVLAVAFDALRLHRVEAHVEGGNDASCRMLERHGFTHEGTLREYELKDGEYIDLLVYARLETD